MITISNLAMQFGGSVLFKQVDLQFTPGNCYGVIGANGAGKSTFLKILSGELEPTSGEVFFKPGARLSVLKQDQNQYDAYPILDTVIMGNQHLYDIMKEKDALYEKDDFTEEDGMKASELETEFAELDGWEAESDASRLLQGLGIPVELHYDLMGNTDPRLKVKVLLAQALFGKPDIIMLDEPTNNLDIEAINWLENFILDYEDNGLVIVVSHDRHFLNTVCTHIVDIDYGKIKMYVGNYDFWYESSQLIQQLIRNKNKRNEEKIAELQTFIARFAANKAKSKQATSRRRLLDKLSVEEMPASSRRYPFVGFEREREVGKDILFVTDVSKTIDGVKLLDKVSFIVGKNDKIAFVGENELAQTTMFKILMGELEPDEGSVKWGQTVTTSYLPKDKAIFDLKMNCDDRGSFTELVRTLNCGQVSINISKPGITKGQHWHHTKWEQFIVVSGHGLIQQRKEGTDEVIEFEVSGDKIQSVIMLPGYTHNIINLSKIQDLVTVMYCNEVFNPERPDTFFDPVASE